MNIFTITILVILTLLLALYLIRNKVKRAVFGTLKVIFVSSLLVALSALFLPQVYDATADFSLRQTGTYESLVSFDEGLGSIINAPQSIWDQISELFGGSANDDVQNTQTGILETNLYPQLVLLFGGILRISALVISILLMIIVLYVSFGFDTVSEIGKLQAANKELVERVNKLEMGQNISDKL